MLLFQIRIADIYQGNEGKITLVWITKGEMPWIFAFLRRLGGERPMFPFHIPRQCRSQLSLAQQQELLPGLFLPWTLPVPHTRWGICLQGGCTAPGWWLIKHQGCSWFDFLDFFVWSGWKGDCTRVLKIWLMAIFFLEDLLSSYLELHHYSFQKYRSWISIIPIFSKTWTVVSLQTHWEVNIKKLFKTNWFF